MLRGLDLDLVRAHAVENPASSGGSSAADLATREELQRVMTRDAGVLRDADSLSSAAGVLAGLTASDPEVVNLIEVSTALVDAALMREESRGTHTRVDFPETSPAFLGRFVFAGAPDPEFVPLPEHAARDESGQRRAGRGGPGSSHPRAGRRPRSARRCHGSSGAGGSTWETRRSSPARQGCSPGLRAWPRPIARSTRASTSSGTALTGTHSSRAQRSGASAARCVPC